MILKMNKDIVLLKGDATVIFNRGDYIKKME